MIAEENLSEEEGIIPDFSISENNLICCIIKLFKQATPYFKSYIKTYLSSENLNENELTQVFVEQLDIQLRKFNYPFGIKNQYNDIYNGSSGFSDFYFHPIEEGKLTASFFSVESKRLPSPTKAREKEYVIGTKENGGIERYKIGKHGKGLSECGMLGFIENEESDVWVKIINGWIENLSTSDSRWKKEEIMSKVENHYEFLLLKSIVHTTSTRQMVLHHFWIK
jgi:hypothetical protein